MLGALAHASGRAQGDPGPAWPGPGPARCLLTGFQNLLVKALRAVRRAIVGSCCSIDDLCRKLFARNLCNFRALCGQGASFGMLFGSILNPWGHFWNSFEFLGSFLKHIWPHYRHYLNKHIPKDNLLDYVKLP